MSEPQIKDALQKGIRAARRGRTEPAQRLLNRVIQADPDNEEAWMWLARVVEEPGQRAECLHRVVQINPDNRWAADQLAEMQAGPGSEGAAGPESAPAASPQYKRIQPGQSSEIELEILKCPHCDGQLDVRGGQGVKTLVCSYCGSVLDLTQAQAAVIGQTDKKPKPVVPIKLGMEGDFKGEHYQVIGWTRYEGWDDEDRWRWDEWLLVSAKGEYRWLSYDPDEGFVFQQRITPLAPFDPLTATSLPVPGGTVRVEERSPARLIALDGELTWQGTVGDQVAYLEARRGQARYSVEYTAEALELFAGTTMPDAEVWTAFGRDDLAQKSQQASEWNRAYKVLAVVCGFLALFSCCAIPGTWATGTSLVTEQVQMVQGESSEQTIGPIEITEPNLVHQVSLQAGGLPVNNWAVVGVSARDPAENEHFLFAAEFWDEAGRDSDGPWRESDLEASYLFKPDEAGAYTFELSMAEATVPSLPVTVTIVQGVWLSRYFVIFMVICLVLTFIFASLSAKRLIGSSIIQSD